MSAPAIVPQSPKMSMDDFAGAIKSKYPGAYDSLDNQELANRVLLKYPQYRQHVNIQSTPQNASPAVGREAALGFAGGMGIPESQTPVQDLGKGIAKTFEYGPNELDKNSFERAMSYIPVVGPVSRIGANLGEKLYGDARDYLSNDPERVAHAGGSAVGTIATLGLGDEAGDVKPISESPVVRTIGKITPKRAAQTVGGISGAGIAHGALSPVGAYYGAKLGGRVAEGVLGKERAAAPLIRPKPSPSEGLPDVAASQPEATSHLNNTVGQMRARIAQPGFPNRAEGLPEVEEGGPAAADLLKRETGEIGNRNGNFRTEQTPRRLPGEVAPEMPRVVPFKNAVRPVPAEPIPSRPGLLLKGNIAKPNTPTGLAPQPIEHWTPPAPKIDFAPNEGPIPGSKEDLADSADIQADIRDRADRETQALRRIGTEEGFARNTRPRTPKSVLTGTEKPPKFTTTPSAAKIAKPSVKASGKEIPAEDLNNPDVLERKLKQSVAKVNKAKKNQ